MAQIEIPYSLDNDPNFAVICGFIDKFSQYGGKLRIDDKIPNFKELQKWLMTTGKVDRNLQEFQELLLRRSYFLSGSLPYDKVLAKFCWTYSIQDAEELEEVGYSNVSLRVKVRMLRELIDNYIGRNESFQKHITLIDANVLRYEPIGHDRLGHTYWLTEDCDENIFVFREHLEKQTFEIVARNFKDVFYLHRRLAGYEGKENIPVKMELNQFEFSPNKICQNIKVEVKEEVDDDEESNNNNNDTSKWNLRVRRSSVMKEKMVVPAKPDWTGRTDCFQCGLNDRPTSILSCTKCKIKYHTNCLSPMLYYVPDEAWLCPECQHEELILALKVQKQLQLRRKNVILEADRKSRTARKCKEKKKKKKRSKKSYLCQKKHLGSLTNYKIKYNMKKY